MRIRSVSLFEKPHDLDLSDIIAHFEDRHLPVLMAEVLHELVVGVGTPFHLFDAHGLNTERRPIRSFGRTATARSLGRRKQSCQTTDLCIGAPLPDRSEMTTASGLDGR